MMRVMLVLATLLATLAPQSALAWFRQSVVVDPSSACELSHRVHGRFVARRESLLVTPIDRRLVVTPIDKSLLVTPYAKNLVLTPPAAVVVVVPPPVGADSGPVWVKGFWHWTGGDWVWVANQWVQPGLRAGFWRWTGTDWMWVPDAIDPVP